MSPVTNPLLPETAPFSPEQRAWLNGYLAGLMSVERLIILGAAPDSVALKSFLILFGSQTGTAENLAARFAQEAGKHGFKGRAIGMEKFAEIDFTAETRVAIVTSTYGDGEMPDNAQAFWDFLHGDGAPKLGHVEFSVLALGDTNYAQFCQAGKDFDRRLEELGAKRVHPRVDCDVDYEETSKQWFAEVMKALGEDGPKAASAAEPESTGEAPAASAGYSKTNPYPARLKTNLKLNGDGSAKETRHVEIILEGSGLTYEVGDALGIVPANCPELVGEILAAAGLDGEEAVATPSGKEKPLRLALTEDFDLKPFLVELPGDGVSARDLVSKLRKLQPRLYSISSSPKAHPGEVHLTVGIVRYEKDGRKHKGVCSTFLADRAGSDTSVPVFIQASPGFKLPRDLAAPIIMVGPGTGIAPFRAFLVERKATGATGRNWLFFGDQRAATDFLYREQLEAWHQEGFLTRLDLAFSRDQDEKIYVQHRMIEQSSELWSWLEQGAYFYVCGDASRMAKDVDAALHRVCEIAGGLDPEAAVAYVKKLKTEKRYCRDIY
jgi:sulfite reductase (NADPH) flavoprotein alpha-component